MKHGLRLVSMTLVLSIGLPGCGSFEPTPTEIPVGGVREPITSHDLTTARAEMPGGLLEPTWLPDGFKLVHVAYAEAAGRVHAVDLFYEDVASYVHIWQTVASPEKPVDSDDIDPGDPWVIADVEWRVQPLPAARVGREDVVALSARLPDGRTVSIDTDLDADVIRRVVESLQLRESQIPER